MVSEKIRKLLLCLLKNEIVVTSWGVTDINISESKLTFCVSGFRYRGSVEIEAIDYTNHYNIYFEGKDMETCDIEHIIEILDMEIENDESNYHKFSKKIFNGKLL